MNHQPPPALALGANPWSRLSAYWPELGILILGLAVSVGLAWLIWSWGDQQQATEIRQRVEVYAQALLILGLATTIGFTALVWNRRRTVWRLLASEERLRLLSNNLPDSAVYQYVHEPDGRVRFLYVSAGIERLNGVSVAEVLADASILHRQIPPEHLQRLVAAEARSRDALSYFHIEVPMRRPDGEMRWMRLCSRPRRLPNGRTLWDGVQTDITDHRTAEEALRRYQQIVETSNEMLVFIDRELRYQLVNPAYAALYQTTPEALCGQRVEEVVSPAIQAELLPQLRAALAGESRRLALHGRDTAGRQRWIETTLRPFLEQGVVQGIVASLHDLTGVREAQAALEAERASLETRVAERTAELQRSEAKLRTIFDLAPVGISITDPHGHIVDCNRAAETILGLTRAAHLARNFDGSEWRILRPDGSLMPAEEYASVRALAEQRPVRDVEMGIETSEGVRWILVSAVPSPHSDYGVIIVYVDISERKQAETSRQAAEAALRDTLAEIQRHDAHMTALNRMNHLLLACDTREEAYQIITRAAGRLFDACPGALAILDDEDPTRLRTVAAWGETGLLSAEFNLTHCWALRRGEVHEVADAATGAQCRHFEQSPVSGYLCLPLNMRGQIRGLLHVGAPSFQTDVQRQEWRTLAVAVSEVVKLALSNIELRERLHAQALRDPLTGLFNRRHLEDMLPRLLTRGQHQGEPLALAMLDVDHFKRFNDTYGHEAGDAVLRALGVLLRGWVRAGDLACRYGGEELTLVLPGCPEEVAQARLEELREAIQSLRVSAQGQDLPQVTVSIGLAVSTGSEPHYALLLARADAALYQAKAGGRNRVVVASADDPPPIDAETIPAALPSNDSE